MVRAPVAAPPVTAPAAAVVVRVCLEVIQPTRGRDGGVGYAQDLCGGKPFDGIDGDNLDHGSARVPVRV